MQVTPQFSLDLTAVLCALFTCIGVVFSAYFASKSRRHADRAEEFSDRPKKKTSPDETPDMPAPRKRIKSRNDFLTRLDDIDDEREDD